MVHSAYIQVNGQRYWIQRKLGEGSFGKVWLVIDDKGHPAVVKSVTLGRNLPAEVVFNEIKVMEWLSSQDSLPFPKYLDSELQGTDHFLIVSEYVEGLTLDQFWNKRAGQPEKRLLLAYNLIRQLSRAVLLLHHFNFVHRDIKPENIIIRKNGDLVLIDFGLACSNNPRYLQSLALVRQQDPDLVRRAIAESTHCQEQFMGTYDFISPQLIEMYQNDRSLTFEDLKKADIWAVGVVLYYLVYDELPFHEANDQRLFDRILASLEDNSHLKQKIERQRTPFSPILLDIFQPLEKRINAAQLYDRLGKLADQIYGRHRG